MRYGHFDNENREYVIDRVDLPCSWTNYLGVEDMAAVVALIIVPVIIVYCCLQKYIIKGMIAGAVKG